MFDSDYKGKTPSSAANPAKASSSSKPGKASKQPDGDSGVGSSLSTSQKSKKAKKQKSSGKPDPLDDELQKRKERQEKATRDQRATQALLIEFRHVQYSLEVETMKNYRALGHISAQQAGCDNYDDHSGYVDYVLANNKQSFVCQSFHLFTVDSFFRRLRSEDRERLMSTKRGGCKKCTIPCRLPCPRNYPDAKAELQTAISQSM